MQGKRSASVRKNAVELFENGLLDTLQPGSFEALRRIHEYLFSEIYEFAGQVRTVNLAKGNFRFAPVMYLEAALKNCGSDAAVDL